MTTKFWRFGGRQVLLRLGYWTGRAEIWIDGELHFERPSPTFLVDLAFARRFEIDDVPCVIRVAPMLMKFRYDC